jgi:hypothetical protein
VQQPEEKNKNKKEEEEFFSLFLSFRRSLIYRQTKQREAFDSFDRLHFSFFCCCCLPACREKKEPSDSDISTPREREKYLSTIRESTTRKRRGNIQHHYHYNPHHHQHKRERQIDVWLVQVILSRFFFFRSFASMLLLYDVLTCVFFLLLLSPSSVVFRPVSLSPLHTVAIITLLDDLVDYFS